MPSVQKCADRLREQAYKALTPQIQALEDELRNVNELIADGVRSVGYKLEALRRTEFPSTELVLNDYLRNDLRKRDVEGEMLALFTRGLRAKETQEEILTSLLDSAANCFPRVALFAVRGDKFKGWSSRGFSDLAAGTISLDEFYQTDCPWLLEAITNEEPTESAELPDIGSLRCISEESQGAWRLYPLHVLGRPVAALLAGETEEAAGRPKALAVLMDCAALQLENITLKIIKALSETSLEVDSTAAFDVEPLFAAPYAASVEQPLPAVEPFEAVEEACPEPPAETLFNVLELNLTSPIEMPEPVESTGESNIEPDALRPNPLAELKLADELPEPVAEISAAVLSEPESEIEPEPETIIEAAPVAVEPDPEPVAPPPVQMEQPAAAPAEPVVEAALVAVEPDPEPVAPPPVQMEQPAVTPAEPVVEAALVAVEPDPEPVAPPPVQMEQPAVTPAEPVVEAALVAVEPDPEPVAPPQTLLNPEEEKLHAAAKRFAKLLISEIKLYNENSVVDGRKNRDLYKRLQKDIDRSREMYEKRVAPTVACNNDYLHDELVRILGDNDAGALGDGYPGPRISG